MTLALITGITGQDGSYMADILLEKGYKVHGIVRRVAIEDPEHRLHRIKHILDRVVLHPASMESFASIFKIVQKTKPDECYHFAAQSFVSYSFEDEFSTFRINIDGTHHMLSAIKEIVPECKFYFAASSEMFGNAKQVPQDEQTPFMPRSSYGISKLAGYHLTRNYREAYGLYACSGILFNHESPRRGLEFVTRKITRAVARIKLGLQNTLELGNIKAKRDWGYAKDYMQAIWKMLQQDNPDDFVIATGETHSVEEFLDEAFNYVGLDWHLYVHLKEKFTRPADIYELKGNCTKAKKTLDWYPKYSFVNLVHMMVDADLKDLERNNAKTESVLSYF